MKIEIKKNVFAKFNDKFMAGLLVCSELENQGGLKEIERLLDKIEKLIKLDFTPINFKTHDLITVWEVAAESLGKKHYKSSVENLMRSILEGHKIRREDRLRNLCNFVSLKYIVPVDCFDLGLIKGDLDFDVKGRDLVFSAGRVKLSEKLALKRNKKYDVKDKTKKALVYFEALPPLNKDKVRKIMEDLADLIRVYCKAKVKIYFLDKKNSEVKV